MSTPKRKIIRVTPTLSTDAYAIGDVLFTATEIPNAVYRAGGCSKLIRCFIIDQDKDTFDLDLIFTQKNTAIGTINATADISDADFEAIGYCGFLKAQSDANIQSHTDNFKVIATQGPGNGGEAVEPFLLQAEDDSESVYVSGIVTDGTPTFAAADDIDIILHIEY